MATCHHLSGATWHRHCSAADPSTASGPPVNGGQRRQSMVVNGGQRRRTTAQWWQSTMVNGGGPPVNLRSTVVDGQSTGGPGQVLGWVRSGIGPGLDQVKFGSGLGRGSGRVVRGIKPSAESNSGPFFQEPNALT
ncbi:hypothetical protein Tco_0035552, partial [Tanacetum coccineum]